MSVTHKLPDAPGGIRRQARIVRSAVAMLCCGPALSLAMDWWQDTLGTNPLDRLVKDMGLWSCVFLLLALAVTPLRRLCVRACVRADLSWGRRLSDWNPLVQARRPLGVACFGYALLHAWCYWWFDAGADLGALVGDLAEKRYLWVGAAALALLAPLAFTSTDHAMRRLGRRWKQLHRLVYPIAVLALLHVWWASKPGLMLPWILGAGVSALLGYHLLAGLGLLGSNLADDGMEVAPRAPRWGRAHRSSGASSPEGGTAAAPARPRHRSGRETGPVDRSHP
jgi:sulfoxide reductase heme-binding subunit YedZ